MPRAANHFAPHSANADVTPHGRPPIVSVAMLTIARPIAPATSGHGPASHRGPRAGFDSFTSAPCRFLSTNIVNQAIAPNTSKLAASPVHGPIVVTSDVGARAGWAVHHPMCAVPITDPMMKKNSV